MEKIKRSYVIIIALLVLTVTFFGASYAFFTSINEQHGKLNIVAGSLDYKLESDSLNDGVLTLRAWETKKLTIKLISLNQINSKYELYYNSDDISDVNIGYDVDTVDSVLGIINSNSTKQITVVVENLKDSTAAIEFGVAGGLLSDNLVLMDGNSINIFTEVPRSFAQSILFNNNLIENEPTLTNSSNNTNDASGLYKSTATNSGEPTYYFRGNVENNYVDFAGFTWRIVRINEDGTIRLILQDLINDNTNYKYNSVNTSKDDMYYTNSDTAKPTLEAWYSSNIGNNINYSEKVATGDYFCEQAKVAYDSDTIVNTGADMTVYSSYTPNFMCSTDGNNKGVVSGSIGLITYDEVVYAGGYNGKNNSSYYLYNNYAWWMMSPADFDGSIARVWRVSTAGKVYCVSEYTTSHFRPVINLKADTVVTGNGTSDNHYIVR